MRKKIRLGVNIDHVATLRQARGTDYPSPLAAALIVQEAGADGLTLHLREDRRHIQDYDVEIIKEKIKIPINLEMAATDAMVEFAEKIKPTYCCLVPEKREELTTEGGLAVTTQMPRIKKICEQLANAGITVSLFLDPDKEQIDAAKICGAPVIELHTGEYADAKTKLLQKEKLKLLQHAADYAASLGLVVNAGHGLHYQNVQDIALIPLVNELNIGHSIIARAMFIGLKAAIQEMKRLISSP